ncbi:MAG: hypothetical protein Q8K82_10035 [Gemmatimonadaceae bacterium]|nr:hypothetical protein [Gemmatimonadaceae bacterium]
MHRRSIPLLLSGALALDQLHAIRHRYGAAEAREKVALVARLERHPPRSARGLAAYHDDLLFLRAFPDDAGVLGAAVAALARMEQHVRSLAPAQRRQLDDQGVAGTTTRHAFAFGTVLWMVNGGEDADIDWAAFDAPERLDPLLRLTLTQAEADAFDSGEISTREWMALARGGTRRGALAWLLQGRDPSAGSPAGAPDAALARLLYESLDPPVSWRLTRVRSTSGNAVTAVPFHARTMMRATPADAAALITTPLPSIERLTPTRAAAWLDAARAALATRGREVHAIAYANPDEVYLADLGEGTALCLIGAAREDRLSLEANYGYVLFSNGVPVGYGGVTPLAAQANTGINIFDAFRHSEASVLFAQALRAFRTLFGITRFVVNPYQFGADNDEALASGAYWFYDRLGFRPVDHRMRTLADRERARRIASRDHRSSPATLRRLAAGDLVLQLPGAGRMPLFEERWLVTLARAVTETLAAPDVPARLAICDAHIDAVAQALGVRRWRASGSGTRFGMERLAPVVALVLGEVAHWPERDRRALVNLFRAKGAVQERDFAAASREHRRLWAALRRRCLELERAQD